MPVFQGSYLVYRLHQDRQLQAVGWQRWLAIFQGIFEDEEITASRSLWGSGH